MTNVHKFVAEKGIDRAREVLDGAPEWAIFWITQGEYHISMLSFPNMVGHHSFLISDLNRLVEDIDLLVEHSLSGCWGIDDIYGIEGTGMYLDGYAFYSNAEEKAELDRLQLALDRTVKAFGGEHV